MSQQQKQPATQQQKQAAVSRILGAVLSIITVVFRLISRGKTQPKNPPKS